MSDFETSERLRFIVAGVDQQGDYYLELQNLFAMVVESVGFNVVNEWEFGWFEADSVSDGDFDCIAEEDWRDWVSLFDTTRLVETARTRSDGYLWAFGYAVDGNSRSELVTELSTADVRSASTLVKIYDPGPVNEGSNMNTADPADLFEEDDCAGCDGSLFENVEFNRTSQ